MKIRATAVGATGYIYEIGSANEPTLDIVNHYPILTTDRVEPACDTITINYHATSIQRLYKIDGDKWKDYQGEAIKVELGQTIYAKGIDKDGNETRIITSHTVSSPSDAILQEAYDQNDTTSHVISSRSIRYMDVDKSIWGQNARFLIDAYTNSYSGQKILIEFLDSKGMILNSIESSAFFSTPTLDTTVTIKENTVKIRATAVGATGYIYEIEPTQ